MVNVGKYTIHGCYGICIFGSLNYPVFLEVKHCKILQMHSNFEGFFLYNGAAFGFVISCPLLKQFAHKAGIPNFQPLQGLH